jgi:hypothetical protein
VAEGKHASPEQGESITKAAKAFIVNPNASALYIQAVSSTVATTVSAIEAKVEREASELSKGSPPSGPDSPTSPKAPKDIQDRKSPMD